MSVMDRFYIKDRIVIITGGAGLLGRKHAEAVIEGGGIPVLLDISQQAIEDAITRIKKKYDNECKIDGYVADITKRSNLEQVREEIISRYGKIDVLINNAANNPKVEKASDNMKSLKFEDFPLDIWMQDISVGLSGAFLCSQVFGDSMAKKGKGIILNISSDLGIIAPDQRIYRKQGLSEEEQTIKPVTYSVIKHGLIGLTKYLATYYADKGVRSNALCPAGVYNGQDEEFVDKLVTLIPMGRMADIDEYMGTILYMISDACSYMTGSIVIIDGGRTCW